MIAAFPVELIEFTYHRGHYKFALKHGDRTRKFTAAGSPTNRGTNIKETQRYIQRFIEGRDT